MKGVYWQSSRNMVRPWAVKVSVEGHMVPSITTPRNVRLDTFMPGGHASPEGVAAYQLQLLVTLLFAVRDRWFLGKTDSGLNFRTALI